MKILMVQPFVMSAVSHWQALHPMLAQRLRASQRRLQQVVPNDAHHVEQRIPLARLFVRTVESVCSAHLPQIPCPKLSRLPHLNQQ